jgi:signal recognition particle GTPase
MGDVLTIIDRAAESIEASSAQNLEKKLRTQSFSLGITSSR